MAPGPALTWTLLCLPSSRRALGQAPEVGAWEQVCYVRGSWCPIRVTCDHTFGKRSHGLRLYNAEVAESTAELLFCPDPATSALKCCRFATRSLSGLKIPSERRDKQVISPACESWQFAVICERPSAY